MHTWQMVAHEEQLVRGDVAVNEDLSGSFGVEGAGRVDNHSRVALRIVDVRAVSGRIAAGKGGRV